MADEGDETAGRDWSDGALVAAVVLHRGDAYAELYRRHSVSVAAAARMILGSRPECDDVVAEVFVGLWFSPEKFDSARGSLLGFLRMKARGRSIDILRTEKSRRRREADELYARQVPVPDAESALLASEASAHLRQAIALLPPAEREVIELAFFTEMTYSAVAVHLKLPEGTVKSRIRNGLRRLRTSDEVGLHREGQGPARVDSTGSLVNRYAFSGLGST